MEKKNIIISSIVAFFVLIWTWTWIYLTKANDDYTCYTFSSSTSACSSNQTNCTDWVNWTRTCNWTNRTTYIKTWEYRCGSSWESSSKSPTNWVCTIKYTDTVTPQATNWGIE